MLLREWARLSRAGSILFEYDFRTAARSSNAFALPSGLALTNSSTSKTIQTSASTIVLGFGANAARARSVDGSTWGLALEKAATNWLPHGTMATMSATNISSNTAVVGPSGATEARRIVDTSSSLGFISDASTWNAGSSGIAGCTSIWAANGTVTSGAGTSGALSTNAITALTLGAYPTTTWARRDSTGTLSSSTNSWFVSAVSDAASQATVDIAYAQFEAGKYPTSVIATAGAAATRNADVLTASTIWTPGGFLDATLVVSPWFTNAEMAADADLIFWDSNNRLYVEQSSKKVTLKLGGTIRLQSSALTWSRATSITVSAGLSLTTGVTLTVSGATTGNGSGSDSSYKTAISLPGTANLCGNASGPQESFDLDYVRFKAAA
jgi:hypothetical protein